MSVFINKLRREDLEKILQVVPRPSYAMIRADGIKTSLANKQVKTSIPRLRLKSKNMHNARLLFQLLDPKPSEILRIYESQLGHEFNRRVASSPLHYSDIARKSARRWLMRNPID